MSGLNDIFNCTDMYNNNVVDSLKSVVTVSYDTNEIRNVVALIGNSLQSFSL